MPAASSLRRTALRGARKLAAEHRAQVQTMRRTGEADEEAIRLAEKRAEGFADLAAEFKAGKPFLPGKHAMECACRKGQGL
jgi:hypothetical protein